MQAAQHTHHTWVSLAGLVKLAAAEGGLKNVQGRHLKCSVAQHGSSEVHTSPRTSQQAAVVRLAGRRHRACHANLAPVNNTQLPVVGIQCAYVMSNTAVCMKTMKCASQKDRLSICAVGGDVFEAQPSLPCVGGLTGAEARKRMPHSIYLCMVAAAPALRLPITHGASRHGSLSDATWVHETKQKRSLLTHTPREISAPASARALAIAHPKPCSRHRRK